MEDIFDNANSTIVNFDPCEFYKEANVNFAFPPEHHKCDKCDNNNIIDIFDNANSATVNFDPCEFYKEATVEIAFPTEHHSCDNSNCIFTIILLILLLQCICSHNSSRYCCTPNRCKCC